MSDPQRWLIVANSTEAWELQGVRFHAPTDTMGPASGTVSADPRKAARYFTKEAAEKDAEWQRRKVVTDDEAWALVLKYPLPEWAKSHDELLAEAKRRAKA